MLLYWRKFDKVEKEHRRKAEKEAIEQKRHDEEMREVSMSFFEKVYIPVLWWYLVVVLMQTLRKGIE